MLVVRVVLPGRDPMGRGVSGVSPGVGEGQGPGVGKGVGAGGSWCGKIPPHVPATTARSVAGDAIVV